MTGQLDTNLRTSGSPVIQTLILTTVMGDTINLLPQLDKLVVYEDIFSPILRGELYLLDNAEFFDVLPISGNEKLSICFYSYRYIDNDPLNYINRTCDVLKVENVTLVNDYAKRYRLIFASPELKKNETIKVSKGYQNKRISEMVADLMTQDYDSSEQNPDGLSFPTVTNNAPQIWSTFLNSGDVEVAYKKIDQFDAVELFVEKTKYSDTLGLPYMKPLDAINWLSGRAIRNNGGLYGSTSAGSANFLFFENKRGFQFVTLDTLIEQKTSFPTLPMFVSGLASANLPAKSPAGTEGRDVNFYSITNLKIEDCYDIIGNIRSGLYASQYLTYDITTGEVNENIWDYMEQYPKMETVDRNMTQSSATPQDFPLLAQDASGKNPLTQKPYSKRLFSILGNREYDPFTNEETARYAPSLQDVGPEQYMQQRLASIARFAQFRISLEIPANSRHKVGDMINFQIDYWTYGQLQTVPTATSSLITSAPHKYYSGCYLITAIKHILTGMDYIMQIEIVKDSTISQIGPVPATNGPTTTP